jgi:hypothetical protein
MMNDDRNQPHKPGGDVKGDGEVRDVDDRQAVRNQGTVTPDDYPDGSDGKPDTPAPPD